MNTAIPEIYSTFDEEYREAREGIGIVDRSEYSTFLFLTGKDVLDFLHRISTNELLDLQNDQVRSTILVTDKAKIVDVITVIPYNDGYLIEITYPNEAAISNWFEKFIIMEDVKINRLNFDFSKFSFIGDKVSSFIKNMGSFEIESKGERLLKIDINGLQTILFRDPLFLNNVWNFYCPKSKVEEVFFHLFSLGKATAQRIGKQVFETIRIEEGVPVVGKELTEQVNPMEAGLEGFISFTKGCYPGQEVISRLTTYDKLQRRLKGFIGSFEGIEENSIIYQANKNVGWITSYTFSPLIKQHLALGYLKTDINTEELLLKTKNGLEYPITKIELPLKRVVH